MNLECPVFKYDKITTDTFWKALKSLWMGGKPEPDKYMLVSKTGGDLIELEIQSLNKWISEREYKVKHQSIIERAYLYPSWDYCYCPIATIPNYNDSRTNQIFDDYEDDYGNLIEIDLGLEKFDLI